MGGNTHTPTRAREGDFKTYGTFQNVKLTDGDMERLRMALASEGRDDTFLNRCIEKLSAFMAQEGRTYQNHAAAILNWAKYAVDEQKPGTAAASRYAKPAPAADPTKATASERERHLREVWAMLKPEEQEQHLKDNNGLHPWEDPKYMNDGNQQ